MYLPLWFFFVFRYLGIVSVHIVWPAQAVKKKSQEKIHLPRLLKREHSITETFTHYGRYWDFFSKNYFKNFKGNSSLISICLNFTEIKFCLRFVFILKPGTKRRAKFLLDRSLVLSIFSLSIFKETIQRVLALYKFH